MEVSNENVDYRVTFKNMIATSCQNKILTAEIDSLFERVMWLITQLEEPPFIALRRLEVVHHCAEALVGPHLEFQRKVNGWVSLMAEQMDYSKVSTDFIFSLAKKFLEEYKCVLREANVFPDTMIFTEEEILHMAAAATAYYLEGWLEHDPKHQLTLYAFEKYGYGDNNPDSRFECQKKFARQYKKLRQLEKIKEDQDRKYHLAPSGKTTQNEKVTRLDYLDLAWIAACRDGSLKMDDLVVFKKHMLRHRSNNDELNISMQAAYENYTAYLEYLHDLSTKIDDNLSPGKVKEFVAKCLMLNKVERDHRFQLIAGISWEYMNRFGPLLVVPKGIPEVANITWAPCTNNDGGLFEFSKMDRATNKSYNFVQMSVDLVYYQQQISALFQTPVEKQEELASKETLRRAAIWDVITVLFCVCPLENMRSWEDSDFVAAAKFLRDQYPLVDAFLEIVPPIKDADKRLKGTSASNYYCTYHNLYCLVRDMPESPLREAISITKGVPVATAMS